MESRGPEDSKNVKNSQAYFFEGFISFFEDFSLTNRPYPWFDIGKLSSAICFYLEPLLNSSVLLYQEYKIVNTST